MRVVQYTRTDTSRVIAFSFLHDPFYSYGSWNNGLRVVQFVNCISLERLRVYIYLRHIYKSTTRMTRTTRPSRETMVYESCSLWELHTLEGLRRIYKSTTRTSRETTVYELLCL